MAEQKLTVKDNYDLGKIAEITAMANVLKNHIVKNELYTKIVGKNYVNVEGWQYAGGLLGVFPRIVKIENLSTTQEIKWLAEAEIVDRRTDKIISRGFAVCSNKEGKKKGFDEYAVLSMAQTRAIGKAYRNVIGWVMKLAGYESTPKEEMVKGNEEAKVAPIQNTPAPTIASLKCAECKTSLTAAEANYSKGVYGRMLCRKDQESLKKKYVPKKILT